MSILQKSVAQFYNRAEARRAMKQTAMPRLVAAVVSAAFLWTLALAVSPQLHERIHADASRVEHNCAVMFVASGGYDHAPSPALIAPLPAIQFSKITLLHPQWVQSPFLSASIFEHAPPQNS